MEGEPHDEPCPLCGKPLGAIHTSSPDRLHGTPGSFGVALCSGCGAGCTRPAVEDCELAAFYPAGYGPYESPPGPLLRVISTTILRWQAWRAHRTLPLRAIAAGPPGRGLDIGAGRGDLAAGCARRGWRMTIIEPSPGACGLARARGLAAIEGTLANANLQMESFDVAIFHHSLEHVPNPRSDLARVREALRPGGLLLISVPNFGNWQARQFGGCWYHLDLPRHRIHLTGDALKRLLSASGFELLESGTSTSAVGLWATLQYRVFGRCLAPAGLPLRFALGLCSLGLPIALATDRLGGGGDTLHAVARRPA